MFSVKKFITVLVHVACIPVNIITYVHAAGSFINLIASCINTTTASKILNFILSVSMGAFPSQSEYHVCGMYLKGWGQGGWRENTLKSATAIFFPGFIWYSTSIHVTSTDILKATNCYVRNFYLNIMKNQLL